MRWTLVAVLALATAAAAQPGPAPGYDDGLTYAVDYASSQGAAAGQDPGGYVAGKATPQGAAAEAEHAAYMACWIADDTVGAPAACDPFYTRPGIAHPEEEAAEDVDQATGPVVEPVEDLANETVDIVEDVVADPAHAAEALPRIVAAVESFAGAVADLAADVAAGVQRAATWIAGKLVGLVDGVGALGVEAGGLTVDMADVTGTALVDAGDAVASTAQEAMDATVSGVSAAVDATGDAVSGVAETVADAAASVRDTLAEWFGGSSAPSSEAVEAPVTVPAADDAPDLLDGVLGTVPEL